MPEPLLSIGELAARTGVAVTALRYYDELGLVLPRARVSGQRRYAASAVRAVGVVLFLREVGFSLAEVAALTGDAPGQDRWADIVDRKLAEIAEQQHRLMVARTALEHARECPAEHPSRCPRFWSIIDAVVDGIAVEEAHPAGHGQAQAGAVGPSGQIADGPSVDQVVDGPSVGHAVDGPSVGHIADGPSAGQVADGPSVGHG